MTFYAYAPPPLVLTLSSITYFLLFSSFAHLILLYLLLHYTDTCPLLSSLLYLLFGGYLPDGVTMHAEN